LNFRGNFRDISASICLHFWCGWDNFSDKTLQFFTFPQFDYVGRWEFKAQRGWDNFGGQHIYFRTFAKTSYGSV